MSKGSGGTRASKTANKAPQTWKEAINAPQDQMLAFVANHITNQNNDLQPDIHAVMTLDQLTDENKNKLLEKLKFSGVVDDDQFYGDMAMFSSYQVSHDRKQFFGYIDDATWYNQPGDDSFFVVKYKDGSMVDSRDFTQPTKIKRTNVAWAMGGGDWDGYMYAPKNYDYMPSLKQWGNFSQWKDGKKVW
ncbi:MAG: hypothetical protein KBS89_07550 [Bacteroidales bacterium]|nr:hypothetical protein [Candidatus Egerieousia equi]